MSDRMDTLAQVLFQKPTLQDCSLQQVDYLAHQYPYFNTAQLLLLQKTEASASSYVPQMQRTALHFSNPLQLHYLLHPEVFETELPEPKVFQNSIPDVPDIEEKRENPEPIEVALPEPEQEPIATQSVVTEAPKVVQPESTAATIPEETPVQQPTPKQLVPEGEVQEEPAITFEPYHTVDYFASQGIKLSKQEAANDKLGKQLKSFTEWLRTMKRLPETTLAQSSDATGERSVENLAAHSLNTADVVTESMAEVWLKQGNKEKAIDVYHKLSLQNPAKSAYFAAKIKSLKQ